MESATNLTIRRVPIASLRPDPANPRAHDDRNLGAIRASLERFGQAEPLVIQASTQRLIAGHGRLDAMKALAWKECDVVELDVDDLTATALGIAMNRTADLSSFDLPALAALLDTLRAEDALAGVGYSTAEIDELLADLDTSPPLPLDDPGPGEPPVNPVTQRGDLFILGEQRILCGDSSKPEDVARVMAGEKAKLLSSDPPYACNYDGTNRPVHDGKKSGKDWSALYHETDIEDLGEFLDGILRAVLPHVVEDAAIYLWHSHLQQPTIAEVFKRHGILFHQVLVWTKPAPVFGFAYYQWQHEPCAFGWRKGHKPEHGQAQLSSVWAADWNGKARFSTFHPTSKPTRLFEIPLEQHTRPGDVVCEPFSGSGTQIIAAEKLGRRCRALEISPAFVDGTIHRWEAATGKQAILEESGKTFAEVATERGVA